MNTSTLQIIYLKHDRSPQPWDTTKLGALYQSGITKGKPTGRPKKNEGERWADDQDDSTQDGSSRGKGVHERQEGERKNATLTLRHAMSIRRAQPYSHR